MADKLKNQLDGLFSGFGGGETDDNAKAADETKNLSPVTAKPKRKAKKPVSAQNASPAFVLSAEMKTVAAMSDLTATVFDPDELLTQMASLICKNFNLTRVNIYFLNKDDDEPILSLQASSEEISDLSRNMVFVENNQSLIARVANENTGAYNNNLTETAGERANARAELAVPMTIVDYVIGVLDVFSAEGNFFNDGHLELFATLAAQIVVASQNIRLLRNSEDQSRRLMLLNEMGASLNVTATLDQALQIATRYISRIIPSDQINIALQIDHRLGWVHLYTYQEATAILDNSQNLPLAGTAIDEVISTQKSLNLPSLKFNNYVDYQPLIADGFSCSIMVPLIAGKQSLGTLAISSKSMDSYSVREEGMLLHIASLLTGTIRNRRLFNQIQSSFTETEILYETSADINTAQSYDEILEALYYYTRLGEDPIDVTLYFFDKPKTDKQLPETVFALSAITELIDFALPIRFNFDVFEDIVSQFNADDPLVLHDIEHNAQLHPDLQTLYIEKLKASDVVFVPLRVGKQVVGFLSASYSHPVTFKETDLRRLSSLVGQAAVATQNVYNLILSEQQTKELTAVNTVLKEISRQLDVSHILKTVYREIQNIVPVEAFYIALIDEKTAQFSFPLVFDKGEAVNLANIPIDNHSDMKLVFQSKETLYITRTQDEIEQLNKLRKTDEIDKGTPAATLLFIPLLLGEQVLGVMSVQSYHLDAYGKREILLMSSMANHLAVAIQNARLYRQAQMQVQREAVLRKVTTHIRDAVDVDSVMRVTVQQLSQALGRRTFIRLRDENSEMNIKN